MRFGISLDDVLAETVSGFDGKGRNEHLSRSAKLTVDDSVEGSLETVLLGAILTVSENVGLLVGFIDVSNDPTLEELGTELVEGPLLTLGDYVESSLRLVTIGLERGATLTAGDVVKRSIIMSLMAVLGEMHTVGDDVESPLLLNIGVELGATRTVGDVVETLLSFSLAWKTAHSR